jgi:NAD+ synthase|tara:strand:+ start:6020 stop:6805 length:786 start_codon:yes stop_codon:yes gene_type:complete
MNKRMVINHIIEWLIGGLKNSNSGGFVVGVSGGIDSALTSTLITKTRHPVILLNMPINQAKDQFTRSNEQIAWLQKEHANVRSLTLDLTTTFNEFVKNIESVSPTKLALANTASRIRMASLYAVANTYNYLVAGTGNKVEDYGIGFFTKYGDGGVDISPIADLLKSEVYELAKYLGVPESIQVAPPTDGLWNDNRSDEDQIGASYEELEWALNYYDSYGDIREGLSVRQEEVLSIYKNRHLNTKHKLQLPPVCEIPKELKE